MTIHGRAATGMTHIRVLMGSRSRGRKASVTTTKNDTWQKGKTVANTEQGIRAVSRMRSAGAVVDADQKSVPDRGKGDVVVTIS